MSKGKKSNYKEEKNKGITLITLVITIIVLIILATVSIGILGGENGIIKKSKYAKDQTEISEEIDILKLCTALAMGEDPNGNVTESNLRNELDKNIKNYTIESKVDKFKVTFESGRAYIVDVNGNVSENAEGWDDIQVANPKVTYNYNGATSGNAETEKQLTYGSTYGILPKPGKTITVTYEYNGATGGNAKRVDTSTFTFGGWYKENNFKNQVIESTQVTTTSNHTLYAKWTGGGITLPTPTKNGYTFECWCTDSGLSNSVGTGGSIYNANSNITLYAKWTQNPIITYTVTYNKNTQDVVENMPSNQVKTQGVNLKLSELEPIREGYTFSGWSTNISQTGTGEYQAGSTYSQDANITLYAIWNKIVPITEHFGPLVLGKDATGPFQGEYYKSENKEVNLWFINSSIGPNNGFIDFYCSNNRAWDQSTITIYVYGVSSSGSETLLWTKSGTRPKEGGVNLSGSFQIEAYYPKFKINFKSTDKERKFRLSADFSK
mgnify:CR=1 FL=1